MQVSIIRKNLIIVFSVLAVYFILFEFFFSSNSVLPIPTLLIESFPVLFKDYSLLFEGSLTVGNVYLALTLGYLLVSIFIAPIIKIFLRFNKGGWELSIFKIFPAFFYALLFAFWFPASIAAQLVFTFIAVVFFLLAEIKSKINDVKPEFIIAAKGLSADSSKIYRDVYWNSIKPAVFKSLFTAHYYVWTLILVYEFITGFHGLGSIYNLLLSYNDLAGLFALAIINSFLIWIGTVLIGLIKDKLIYWEV